MSVGQREFHDSRLHKAFEQIASGKVKVLSLDIFDTLLWRKVPQPQDLFLLLGKRFQEEGWLLPGITPQIFAILRERGELLARKEKKYLLGTSELTLLEIYWKLQGIFVKLTLKEMLTGALPGIYETDLSSAVQIEIEVEKKIIRHNRFFEPLIGAAQRSKIPIVLVSNTYFEEIQLLDFCPLSLKERRSPTFFSLQSMV